MFWIKKYELSAEEELESLFQGNIIEASVADPKWTVRRETNSPLRV